jgi:spore maturation protein SpmB
VQDILSIVLESGKSAVELALFVLVPIMVVMMALMKLIKDQGALARFARLLSPPLRFFGIPGIGVFAILQLLLVSYAAPVATLAIMDKDGTSKRRIAATLAMILAMAQGNAVFPLLAVGLNLPITILVSLVGGLSASSVTFYLLTRSDDDVTPLEEKSVVVADPKPKVLESLRDGGEDGLWLALQQIPMLVLVICLLKLLQAAGLISLLQQVLSPLLAYVGLSGTAVLPLVTKYLAGGTAMIGVAADLVHEGALTALELNRLAGFMINPLDLVGVTVLVNAISREKGVATPAILGATFGILVRGILHLILF